MTRFSRRALLASSLVLASTRLGLAQRKPGLPVSGADQPDLAPFDRLLTAFVTDNKLPGASVAVSHAGKVVYARGFGFADVEKQTGMQAESQLRLASVSKPITAAGVLRLMDEGKLALDERVLKYVALPPFVAQGAKPDARWDKITLRHCLQHTGGWDRERQGGFDPIGIPAQISKALKLAGPPSPDDIVRYMLGQPLDFEPGTRHVYSNLGYLVLGRVIEAVTGEKYEPWIRRTILAPVGAGAMSLGRALPEMRPKSEVSYYDSHKRHGECLYAPRAGKQVPLPDGAENIEGFEAHGGWIASASDLVRFASAFDYGAKSPLLSAEAIVEMWKRPAGELGLEADGKPKAAYYGCGWMVRPVGNGARANTWHNGLIAGTSTLLVRRFDGLNWAVLFNTDDTFEDKQPAGLIDGPMHAAADAVKSWPG